MPGATGSSASTLPIGKNAKPVLWQMPGCTKKSGARLPEGRIESPEGLSRTGGSETGLPGYQTDANGWTS